MLHKIIVVILICCAFSPPVFAEGSAEGKESAYDRVIRTNTLRCGYSLWPTYLEKDPNTGTFSGIWYDYTEELGKLLNLKVEWVAEVGFGEIPTALANNKFDAFCSGLWQDIAQAKSGLDYVIPVTYQGVVAVVRHQDKRFDNDLSKANVKGVTVATIDGDMSDIIRQSDFPKAGVIGLPSMSEPNQMLMNIVGKKADITFTSPETALRFNQNNKNALRALKPEKPLRVFAEVLAVKFGEDKLARLLSYGTFELLNRGTIDEILDKYEVIKGSFYRVAKPYRTN